MAEIVYTTAPSGSDDSRNDEGSNAIFAGHSFFLARNVPTRTQLINDIKAHGGGINDIDRHADFIIVDHKKNAPGSGPAYSYKFIEDCVKNNKFEDIDNYEISKYRKPAVSSSSNPVKKGFKGKRTIFTAEDDDILLSWLSRPGMEKVSLSGNKIYQELAERFPQHTMHSWRGRWVDILSDTMPDGPKPRHRVRFSDADDKPAVKKDQPRFDRTDDEILIKMKDEIIKTPNNQAVYERIHQKHPHHTIAQWRERFEQTLLPLLNQKSIEKPPVNEGISDDISPESAEGSPERQLEQAKNQKNSAAENPASDPVANDSHVSKQGRPRRASVGGAGSNKKESTAPQQSAAAEKSKNGRKAASVPPDNGPVVPLSEPEGSQSQIAKDAKPSTPIHHDSALKKPPKSPKGHPMRDLPLSPPRNDMLHPSPAKDKRVHQWAADVSKHIAETDSQSIDEQIATQIHKEIKESSPAVHDESTPDPSSPLSATDVVLENKRKRPNSHDETTAHNNKRSRIAEKSTQPYPPKSKSVLRSETSKITSEPFTPPRKPKTFQLLKRPSPVASNNDSILSNAGSSIRPRSSKSTPSQPIDQVNTQALYDRFQEDDEPLVNEEIPGIFDDSSDEEAAERRRQDATVFDSKGDSAVKPRRQAATLDFSSGRGLDLDDDYREDDDGEIDPDVLQREEIEISQYLVEKAEEYGLEEKDVIEAIERTSGEKRLVDVVLQSMKDGHGIPVRHIGIYTVEEDEILLSNDSKAISEVEKRHGTVIDRIEWLEKYHRA